jgi:hypothetical protein
MADQEAQYLSPSPSHLNATHPEKPRYSGAAGSLLPTVTTTFYTGEWLPWVKYRVHETFQGLVSCRTQDHQPLGILGHPPWCPQVCSSSWSDCQNMRTTLRVTSEVNVSYHCYFTRSRLASEARPFPMILPGTDGLYWTSLFILFLPQYLTLAEQK